MLIQHTTTKFYREQRKNTRRLSILLLTLSCAVFLLILIEKEDVNILENSDTNNNLSDKETKKISSNNNNHNNVSKVVVVNKNSSRNDDEDYEKIRRRKNSCYVNYKSPIDRAMDTLTLYQKAQKKTRFFGDCGSDKRPTSLMETAEKFNTIPPKFHNMYDDDDDATSSSSSSSISIKNSNDNNNQHVIVGVRHVTLAFQAISNNSVPRTSGGDEFILTLNGWSSNHSTDGNNSTAAAGGDSTTTTNNTIAFKTAAWAEDLHNGIYIATLPIPNFRLRSFNLTLMHYYTCYQGFTKDIVHPKRDQSEYYPLVLGPVSVMPHSSFSNYLLVESPPVSTFQNGSSSNSRLATTNNNTVSSSSSSSLPKKKEKCQGTQIGVDYYSHGIWVETSIPNGNEITNQALWKPLCCQLPDNDDDDFLHVKKIRIGDSTMPKQTLHVGNVYSFSSNGSYNKWNDYLWGLINSTSSSSNSSGDDSLYSSEDVLVINSALHYLLKGYHPTVVVDLVIRMICQLAILFPGKIVWVGPVPIQQQLYPKIDQTDMDVRLINAIMRQRVYNSSGGRLEQICDHIPIARIDEYPDDRTGHYKKYNETKSKIQEVLSLSSSEIMTKNRTAVIHYFQSILEEEESSKHQEQQQKIMKSLLYKNRSLWFTEIDHFLRPRPETYRDNDKIHDMRKDNMLFFGKHAEWIKNILKLRHMGEA